MPRIKPYELQTSVSTGGAKAQGIDLNTAGAIGRGIQQFAGAVGEVENSIKKRNEQEDLSNIHVNISQKQAEWTVKYNKELQEGTLNTEQFTQDFNEDIDKIAEGVNTHGGNLYFKQASAELKGHFLENASLGEAKLAGEKAVSNYSASLNAGSATLVNDPSSFTLTHKMQMDGIDNLVRSGSLPALKSEELKQESTNALAKAAVRGWVNLNPEAAKEQLNKGMWDKYLGNQTTDAGTVKLQLMGEADQAIKGKDTEANRLKQQQKEAKELQQISIQNKFLEAMNEDKLSTKDILASGLDPFGSGSKEQFLRMIDQNVENKQKPLKTDANSYLNLFERINLPDGDPNKLTDENELNKAFLAKRLSKPDLDGLRGEMQGKKTIAGSQEDELKKGLYNIARGELTKSNALTGFSDPQGDTNLQSWHAYFITEYKKQRDAGKSPGQLLDPQSSDYLGKSILNYKRSLKQIMSDQAKSLRQGPSPTPTPVTVEPRKTGESADSYLKRLGK